MPTISIEVAEVLAGANRLGSGTLRMVRSAGRLSISPLALSIPGGKRELRPGTDKYRQRSSWDVKNGNPSVGLWGAVAAERSQ